MPEAPQEMAARHAERMGQHLGLDPQKREAFRRQAAEVMPAILAQREEVGRIRRALRDEVEKDELDMARIRGLVRSQSAAQAHLDSLVSEAMLGEARLLTPQQRRRYFHKLPWGEGRGGRRGGEGRPPGPQRPPGG